MFVTNEILSQFSIGIGDEVFVTGLFRGHTGRQRNVPIVRVGNIAAMPEEKVRTSRGDCLAYLIQSVRIASDRDDLAAGSREGDRRCMADSACRTGDDDALAGE